MMPALWTAGSGMRAQQMMIDTISNNLANVNTVGFKKSRVDFQDLLYQTMRGAGTPSVRGSLIPVGVQLGHGVRPAATQKVFTEGDIRPSDNPLDMVIEGDGFFRILMPDGEVAYTRDGTFKVDSEGRMVTTDGFPVEPEIVIPADAKSVTISADGTVSVLLPGQNEPQVLGQLMLTKFINPAGLESIGRNLYRSTPATGDPVDGTPGIDGFGSISQGYLEMANVQVVEEMVNMIVAQRAYEVNAKAIQASDEMLQLANNLRR